MANKKLTLGIYINGNVNYLTSPLIAPFLATTNPLRTNKVDTPEATIKEKTAALPVNFWMLINIREGFRITSATLKGTANALTSSQEVYTLSNVSIYEQDVNHTSHPYHTNASNGFYVAKNSAGLRVNSTSGNVVNYYFTSQKLEWDGAYGEMTDARAYAVLKLYLTVEADVSNASITYDLTNCICDIDDEEVESGEIVDFTLEADNDYFWFGAPYIEDELGVKTFFTRQVEGSFFLSYKVEGDITVKGLCVEEQRLVYTLTNSTTNFSPFNDLLNDVNIVLTANESFKFTSEALIDYWDDTTGIYNYGKKAFPNEDGSKITFTLPFSYFLDPYDLPVNVKADAFFVDETSLGFISVYRMSKGELIELGLKRFYEMNIGDSSTSITSNDNYNWIISVKKFYISLDSPTRQHVYLGRINTNIEADYIKQDAQRFLAGSFTVPNLQNSYDYEVTYRINLPFIGEYELNINNIVNKTVSVWYSIDPLNGNCAAILIDENETTLYSFNGNVSDSIPLVNLNTENIASRIGDVNHLNDLSIWIEKERPKRLAISSFKGDCSFSYVKLVNTNRMLLEDKEEILMLLSDTVEV